MHFYELTTKCYTYRTYLFFIEPYPKAKKLPNSILKLAGTPLENIYSTDKYLNERSELKSTFIINSLFTFDKFPSKCKRNATNEMRILFY